jgi:hypothetical protein
MNDESYSPISEFTLLVVKNRNVNAGGQNQDQGGYGGVAEIHLDGSVKAPGLVRNGASVIPAYRKL